MRKRGAGLKKSGNQETKQTEGLVLSHHVVTKRRIRPVEDGMLKTNPPRKLRPNNKL